MRAITGNKKKRRIGWRFLNADRKITRSRPVTESTPWPSAELRTVKAGLPIHPRSSKDSPPSEQVLQVIQMQVVLECEPSLGLLTGVRKAHNGREFTLSPPRRQYKIRKSATSPTSNLQGEIILSAGLLTGSLDPYRRIRI